MKGYKVFEPDWTCRAFQYEVGKTYTCEEKIALCKEGFHFCKKLIDCFSYYHFNPKNKVAEVEALGDIEEGGVKVVTNKIKIVREMTWNEVLTIVNMGNDCTGYCNVGHNNSGNYNCGDFNSGDENTGLFNSGCHNCGDNNAGDYNVGDYNIGSCNTGRFNVGHNNTGDYNTGDYNTGDYNIGSYCVGYYNNNDYCMGFFNSKSSPVYMFNKPTSLTWEDALALPGIGVLESLYHNVKYIKYNNMTEDEKKEHPEAITTGGYLKPIENNMTFQNMWNNLCSKFKQDIINLPNFDPIIFKELTGIDVKKGGLDSVCFNIKKE